MLGSFWRLIDLKSHGDHRGSLVSIEGGTHVDFEFKRIYYIYGTKEGVRRGFHAHQNLEQLLVAVSGSCRVLVDDGSKKETITLESRTKGLLISHLVWREMFEFSADCVLLVMASDHYQESDYIRDYSEFENAVKRYR